VNFDIAYKVMLPALQFFTYISHSYGWAIIFLTLAVRVIVWPLVAQSTRSMQRMSKLQPQLKLLQDRYKENPEMLQKKTMEFYSKNKMNPLSGCLPTLIQLPVLFALFATFSGPPFGDKLIDVKVNVVNKAEAKDLKQNETSGGNSAYIHDKSFMTDGTDLAKATFGSASKLVVFPGDATVAVGDSMNFGVRAIEGELPKDFIPNWKVIGPDQKNPQGAASDPANAEIDTTGHVTFNKAGEYHVLAKIPGIAKNEPFYFIGGLGKVAHGLELFQPANWDTLCLILLFGATMFLSQKFTLQQPKVAPGQELDEQQLIQQQTAKTMPIVGTAVFFFVPLPTGVYLYMVVSNVMQTLQTWLIMRMPEPALVDVLGDGNADDIEIKTVNKSSSDNGNGGAKKSNGNTAGGGNSSNKRAKKKKN
jgi:YidC/Oxa1 family membrane protein insertase